MSAAARLRRLRETLTGPATLGELTALLGREGLGLLVFLIALPFLQPIPLAGLGTPVGLMLIALGFQLAAGREAPALPRFVASRRLEAATIARVLSGAERLLDFAGRFSRPRWSLVVGSRRALGAAIAVLGAIFAIPVFVPFGNPLTAAALALLGLSLAEEDGLLGALGLGGTAAAVAYHAAFAVLVWKGASVFAGWRP